MSYYLLCLVYYGIISNDGMNIVYQQATKGLLPLANKYLHLQQG